jgi:hypothetical protein
MGGDEGEGGICDYYYPLTFVLSHKGRGDYFIMIMSRNCPEFIDKLGCYHYNEACPLRRTWR